MTSRSIDSTPHFVYLASLKCTCKYHHLNTASIKYPELESSELERRCLPLVLLVNVFVSLSISCCAQLALYSKSTAVRLS